MSAGRRLVVLVLALVRGGCSRSSSSSSGGGGGGGGGTLGHVVLGRRLLPASMRPSTFVTAPPFPSNGARQRASYPRRTLAMQAEGDAAEGSVAPINNSSQRPTRRRSSSSSSAPLPSAAGGTTRRDHLVAGGVLAGAMAASLLKAGAARADATPMYMDRCVKVGRNWV